MLVADKLCLESVFLKVVDFLLRDATEKSTTSAAVGHFSEQEDPLELMPPGGIDVKNSSDEDEDEEAAHERQQLALRARFRAARKSKIQLGQKAMWALAVFNEQRPSAEQILSRAGAVDLRFLSSVFYRLDFSCRLSARKQVACFFSCEEMALGKELPSDRAVVLFRLELEEEVEKPQEQVGTSSAARRAAVKKPAAGTIGLLDAATIVTQELPKVEARPLPPAKKEVPSWEVDWQKKKQLANFPGGQDQFALPMRTSEELLTKLAEEKVSSSPEIRMGPTIDLELTRDGIPKKKKSRRRSGRSYDFAGGIEVGAMQHLPSTEQGAGKIELKRREAGSTMSLTDYLDGVDEGVVDESEEEERGGGQHMELETVFPEQNEMDAGVFVGGGEIVKRLRAEKLRKLEEQKQLAARRTSRKRRPSSSGGKSATSSSPAPSARNLTPTSTFESTKGFDSDLPPVRQSLQAGPQPRIISLRPSNVLARVLPAQRTTSATSYTEHNLKHIENFFSVVDHMEHVFEQSLKHLMEKTGVVSGDVEAETMQELEEKLEEVVEEEAGGEDPAEANSAGHHKEKESAAVGAPTSGATSTTTNKLQAKVVRESVVDGVVDEEESDGVIWNVAEQDDAAAEQLLDIEEVEERDEQREQSVTTKTQGTSEAMLRGGQLPPSKEAPAPFSPLLTTTAPQHLGQRLVASTSTRTTTSTRGPFSTNFSRLGAIKDPRQKLIEAELLRQSRRPYRQKASETKAIGQPRAASEDALTIRVMGRSGSGSRDGETHYTRKGSKTVVYRSPSVERAEIWRPNVSWLARREQVAARPFVGSTFKKSPLAAAGVGESRWVVPEVFSGNKAWLLSSAKSAEDVAARLQINLKLKPSEEVASEELQRGHRGSIAAKARSASPEFRNVKQDTVQLLQDATPPPPPAGDFPTRDHREARKRTLAESMDRVRELEKMMEQQLIVRENNKGPSGEDGKLQDGAYFSVYDGSLIRPIPEPQGARTRYNLLNDQRGELLHPREVVVQEPAPTMHAENRRFLVAMREIVGLLEHVEKSQQRSLLSAANANAKSLSAANLNAKDKELDLGELLEMSPRERSKSTLSRPKRPHLFLPDAGADSNTDDDFAHMQKKMHAENKTKASILLEQMHPNDRPSVTSPLNAPPLKAKKKRRSSSSLSLGEEDGVGSSAGATTTAGNPASWLFSACTMVPPSKQGGEGELQQDDIFEAQRLAQIEKEKEMLMGIYASEALEESRTWFETPRGNSKEKPKFQLEDDVFEGDVGSLHNLNNAYDDSMRSRHAEGLDRLNSDMMGVLKSNHWKLKILSPPASPLAGVTPLASPLGAGTRLGLLDMEGLLEDQVLLDGANALLDSPPLFEPPAFRLEDALLRSTSRRRRSTSPDVARSNSPFRPPLALPLNALERALAEQKANFEKIREDVMVSGGGKLSELRDRFSLETRRVPLVRFEVGAGGASTMVPGKSGASTMVVPGKNLQDHVGKVRSLSAIQAGVIGGGRNIRIRSFE
eukprot:g13915.t1